MSAYILTREGKRLDLLHPHPDLVSLESIAIGLSREGRFHNQTIVPYNVAQHSIEVSLLCQTRAGQMWGLFHDAGEAYYRDIASLLKKELGKFWRDMELAWKLMLAEKFNLRLPMPDEVKKADRIMLAVERRSLLPIGVEADNQFAFNEDNLEVPPRIVKVMSSYEAELAFLTRYDWLKNHG